MAIPTGSRRLSLAQQAFALRQVLPGAQCRIRHGSLACQLRLQPSESSRPYTLRVEYPDGGRPATRVVDPPLEPRTGTARLPHVYTGDELCLYLPGEWNPAMSIARTIIPWASEWLWHYELWLATGEWSGGGHEPPRGA